MESTRLLTVCVAALSCATLWGVAFAQQRFALPPGLPAAPTTGPALCRGNFLTPEQGKAVLYFTLSQCPTLAAWQSRADNNRKHIQSGAGLEPWPKRSALNPIIRDKRTFDGYTVENVALESIPGFYVTGNLYRPLNARPPYAAVLCTHGHGQADALDQHPRFLDVMQYRCAALARMGAVVFSIDMFGWGDSQQQVPY